MSLHIKGVTDDSRKVESGYLFVAIKGLKHDGHDYVEEAAQKGALAVVSEEIESSSFLPVIQVKNVRKALATLVNWFYGYPSRKLRVIGVTGTNGKTTTTFMIDTILRENNHKTGLIGTMVVRIDQEVRKANLTTPAAQELQEAFAQMVKLGVEYTTMEVSSQGLSMYRVDGVDFDCGLVTNLTLDHLDCHPTFTHYLEAKKKFFQMLGQGRPIFLNADDSLVLSMAKETRGKILTYGLMEKADFQAENIQLNDGGSSFFLRINKKIENHQGQIIRPQEFPIELKVLGRHNIYNALSAGAIALYHGVNPENIQKGLASFQPVERRMQLVYDQEVKIIDDTALNPGSIDVVFQAVEKMQYNNLIVINAIRGNRSPAVNQENANAIALWLHKLGVKELISTSSVEHVGIYDIVSPEEKEAFCGEIVKQAINLQHFSSLPAAIEYGIDKLSKGDLLLLLGAQGMDEGAQLALEFWEKKKALPNEVGCYYQLMAEQTSVALDLF